MKYQAKPVIVDAFKITVVRGIRSSGVATLDLEDGRVVVADATMTARMWPKVGDYWVIQEDGYNYLNPAEVFTRKYEAADPNALELGAAVRKAGKAGQ